MRIPLTLSLVMLLLAGPSAGASPARWAHEWPQIDFESATVDLDEIRDGGPPKDGIPAIDDPRFQPAAEVDDLADAEPVIGLTMSGESRAYPLRVLTWHEIVNDVVAGVPVAVTYCPCAMRRSCSTGAWTRRSWTSAPPGSSATRTS